MDPSISPDPQKLADRLFGAAEEVVRRHDLRFGEGADGALRLAASRGAHFIMAQTRDLDSNEARMLIERAEQNLSRFTEKMVEGRLKVYDREMLGKSIVGEQTYHWARDKLCPIFPIC